MIYKRYRIVRGLTKERCLKIDRNIIFGMIHKVDNQFGRSLDQVALKHDLTGIQALFLKYIYDKSKTQDVFQKDLEKVFDIRRSSVSTMMSCMEKKGYIIRESIPDDKRIKKIVLTEVGLKKHIEVDNDVNKYKESLLEDFSDEDISLFFNALEMISKKIQEK